MRRGRAEWRSCDAAEPGGLTDPQAPITSIGAGNGVRVAIVWTRPTKAPGRGWVGR